ncbi:hypothetical protein ACSDVY_004678, partial [Vibrio alginolyticus]
YICNQGEEMDPFEELDLLDVSLLSNLQKVIQDENDRIENEKKLESEIFNRSKCQCAGEAYEFSIDQRLKSQFQNDFLIVSSGLLIIGLYKQTEIYFKAVVAEHHDDKSNRVRDKLCSLNSSLQYYDAINELRLLNNCVKHAGIVSKSLADNYPKWGEGELLGNLLLDYERLIADVRRYVSEHEKYIEKYT